MKWLTTKIIYTLGCLLQGNVFCIICYMTWNATDIHVQDCCEILNKSILKYFSKKIDPPWNSSQSLNTRKTAICIHEIQKWQPAAILICSTSAVVVDIETLRYCISCSKANFSKIISTKTDRGISQTWCSCIKSRFNYTVGQGLIKLSSNALMDLHARVMRLRHV